MIIVLNGPLGIGKSTLAEALTESIESCVMLDGDRLVAANPPSADEMEHLHSTIALLVTHHRRFGYRHFVIDHYGARRRSSPTCAAGSLPSTATRIYGVSSSRCRPTRTCGALSDGNGRGRSTNASSSCAPSRKNERH